MNYPCRFGAKVHDEHSVLTENDTVKILQKNRSYVGLPQVIALMSIFDHLSVQIDHQNVICIDMNTLVANCELKLSSIFVLYQVQLSISDIQLALPIDQELRFLGLWVIFINLYQVVSKQFIAFVGKNVEFLVNVYDTTDITDMK